MTEAEWNDCSDPQPMLEFLDSKVSERKRRLFAVVCVRRILHLLTDPASSAAMDVSELYADGMATADALAIAQSDVYDAHTATDDILQESGTYAAMMASRKTSGLDILGVLANAASAAGLGKPEVQTAEKKAQALSFRDIFGPLPFRSVTIHQRCLSAPVTALAQAIYTDHAFDRMPILADPLEEAGCTDPDILAHSRGPGPHVRGCWVVDLLLGKT